LKFKSNGINKALGEVALFVLPLGRLVRLRQNKMCHLCGCQKIKKQKMCGGKKIKLHSVGSRSEGRNVCYVVKKCSFHVSLFNVSTVAIGFPVTIRGLA